MTLDLAHLRSWIGRTETLEDTATAAPVRALAATLDRDGAATRDVAPLPPCWHWLYFLPTARHSEIGADGHPQRGGFLPPVPLPGRMWAGSRIQFLAPLQVGDALLRHSRIQDVQVKDGRSGPLVFAKVVHEIHRGAQPLIVEEQDIVYRGMPAAGEAPPAAAAAPMRIGSGASSPIRCCCSAIRR